MAISNLNDLLVTEQPDPPKWGEGEYSYVITLRKSLRDARSTILPMGPTPSDLHNFAILAHRLDAQIELCDLLLANLTSSLEPTTSNEVTQ